MDQPLNIFNSTVLNLTINSTNVNQTFQNPTTTPTSFKPTLVTITYVGLLVGIIVFALLGNLLVITVFLFDHRLRVSSSYYMLSLAVSDVITAAFVMTLEVDQFLNGSNWRHSTTLCEAWTTAYLFTVPVSILTACASSIDRWYAISRPLKYRTGRNVLKHKALGTIVLVWIYSIVFALIPKMGWNPPDVAITSSEPMCFFDIEEEYSILSSILNFILPSFITAVFYFNMFTAMKKHTIKRRKLSSASDCSHRSPSQKKNDRMNFLRNVNLAKSYAMIGSLLIVTWCPFTTISIFRNVCGLVKSDVCYSTLKINPNVELSLLMLGYFNSAINPVVYVLRFRAFRVTIRDWFFCRKRCMPSS